MNENQNVRQQTQAPQPSHLTKETNRYFSRVLMYLAGMFILAFGVVFAVNANLGISPVSSVPFAVFTAFNHNGVAWLTLGNCVTIAYVVYVLLQIPILGKQFKITSLLQVVVALIYGLLVDAAKVLMNGWAIPTYAGSLVMLAISIVLIVIGLSLYLGADLMPMASEGLGLAITKRLGKYPYHRVKLGMDIAFVVLAVAITLVFTGRVQGVREGTVITTLLVGPLMGLAKPLLKPLMARFGPPQKTEAAPAEK